ncbi:MAG: HEPN domain-containing protein, partial [Candidatus Accumulibacter sp.]|nr:HEPN domain-containing protein [Accumulibacter sp.]
PIAVGKTHSGLIGAFTLHLVKHGPISREMGRLLKRAQEIRLVADYRGSSVELDDARQLVEQAHRFIDAICSEFPPGTLLAPGQS